MLLPLEHVPFSSLIFYYSDKYKEVAVNVETFPFRFYSGSFPPSKLRNFLNAGKLKCLKGRDEFVMRGRNRDKGEGRARRKKRNGREGQKKKRGEIKRWKERGGGSRNEKDAETKKEREGTRGKEENKMEK